MNKTEDARRLRAARKEAGCGGNYTPGVYREQALTFLKERIDTETYNCLMRHGECLRHPYVAAKIYLNAGDWDKYIWIEQHGSLEGYPE